MKIPFSDQAYDQMLASLFVRYPSFGSVGAGAYKPGLERMEEILTSLGSGELRRLADEQEITEIVAGAGN